jgi:hypothetical protein
VQAEEAAAGAAAGAALAAVEAELPAVRVRLRADSALILRWYNVTQ